jgi:hypothetical protein
MDDLDPKHLPFIVKALMQQAAKTKVELYALRLLVLDSCGLSPEDFDRCHDMATKRYATLLQLVSEGPLEQTDFRDLLKAFEGPLQ